MNFKRKNQVLSNFNAAPMNDIIFFLLLFFLLTSSFAIPSFLKVSLAKADSGEKVVKQTIAITITADNKYYIDANEISSDKIEAKIVEIAGGKENIVVNLRNDKAASWETIARVMNQANKMKAAVILATEAGK